MKIVLIAGLLLAISSANAQETTCEVKVDALKGKYEGDCVKGKADGLGIATGTDNYEGAFKNGYPDGIGRYNWKNGNYYFGSWKKGAREGKGEMHIMVEGMDSMVTGYWKKDEYKGKYEKPYIIHSTTSDIGRVEVSKIKGIKSTISIEVQNMSGGTVDNTYGVPGTSSAPATTTKMASLTEIRMLTGTFNTKAVSKMTKKEISVLQGVIFPFRAVLAFENTLVDIEILEEGEWTINVPIQR